MHHNILLLFVLIFLFSFHTPLLASSKKPYVVYLGAHSHASFQPSSVDFQRAATNSHHDLLASFVGSKDKAKSAIIYSYTNHINGFAAMLEEEEAKQLSKHPAVISVFLDEEAELHTTRSWEFLGLETNDGYIPEESLWKKARFGEDTIIGNLDTGVWPESASFDDDGIGPIPSRWKGSCNSDGGLRCNRKLIGANYYKKGYEAQNGPINAGNSSARDFNGHGTHTLATAGGRFVPGADFLGFGKGTAKGGSANARVAAYKVCWPGCTDADILAAFDEAIADGVDILSVSLGGRPRDYAAHGISIGAFHATMKGILVVCSAGNSGPFSSSVNNVAPWIMTVAASTMDRDFPSHVHLANGQILRGQSLSTAELPGNNSYPLILSIEANTSSYLPDAFFCRELDPAKVKGKIVVCSAGGFVSSVEKGEVVMKAGGAGMIVAEGELSEIHAFPHFLPAANVGPDDNVVILRYNASSVSPTAYITKPITEVGVKPAPRMAAFSSQGPNSITPEILKPDVTAPGVNVLAAYSPATSPSHLPSDPRRLSYNIISGTSMSCPHISGIAALLKTLHPEWSPAAIKSAIMTTAQTQDNTGMQIRNASLLNATPFSYGHGHVLPNSAADPGLIYDLTIKDYFNFFCGIGYNETQIAKFTNQTYKCDPNSSLLNFNCPSITIPDLGSGPITVSRRVKNVGSPSTYSAKVIPPLGVDVSVQPTSMKFEKMDEEKTFEVSLKGKGGIMAGEYVFGKLIWSDGIHQVSSPIVVGAAVKP
ncbi:hypothetical protein ACLOJK_015588 [Asimina triloba]